MLNKKFRTSLVFRVSLLGVLISYGVFPQLMASNALAEPQDIMATTENYDHQKTANNLGKSADDHKKRATTPAKSSVAGKVEETKQQLPQKSHSEEKKNVALHTSTATDQPTAKSEEGLSTISKVGIGVGVAAVFGGAALLSGGGGSKGSSPPRYPTEAELVGLWDAQGTNYETGMTYTGIFQLYDNDNHSYEIYTSDGTHKQGRGSWSITAGTNTLTIKNDTGSTYSGDFQGGNYKTITLQNHTLPWNLILNKK